MKLIVLCILAIVASCYGEDKGDVKSVESCYYCESKEHPNCDDPFNRNTGTSVKCKEFIESIHRPEVRKAVSFNRALNQEKRVFENDTEYRCIKTRIVHKDATPELIRMCIPIEPTMSSACGYLKEQISDDVTMKSCHECKSDNCNGSSYIVLSLWSMFAFLLAKVF